MQMQSMSMDRKSTQEDLTPHYGEDTPAYQVLKKHHLLNASFRVNEVDPEGRSLQAEQANSTPMKNTAMEICCCFAPCCYKSFTTPRGSLQLVEDGRGNFKFYGPGVHFICDPWYKVNPNPKPIATNIAHGDRTIVVVDQGQIGFALDKGQPLLLPPGLHMWQSPTMNFVKSYDLNNNVIRMGPLTLVTVDEGYSAVTEDNGLQKILPGGETYLLTHRNWKFQKYLTEKIQSSNLKRIEATSADNVLMSVDATVIWRISDVSTAARNSADTISKDGTDDKQNLGDIKKLSNDVLKQAEASLAAFIGAVQYSDTFNVAAAVQRPALPDLSEAPVLPAADGSQGGSAALSASASAPAVIPTASPLFDPIGLKTVVEHANNITCTYGVTIISINVVAAVPSDSELMNSLAQGAVAAAEAQKYETVARGRASAAQIAANGDAEATIIRARGDASAEQIRAEGARAAADKIESSEAAVKFTLIDKTGMALNDKSCMFFGGTQADVGSLLLASGSKMASSLGSS